MRGTWAASILFGALNACGGPSYGAARRDTSRTVSTVLSVAARDTTSAEAPDCIPSNGVLCLQDTAYVDKTEQVGGSIAAQAMTLWFGRASDSLVLIVSGDAVVQTSIGDEKDRLHNNGPFFHGRVLRDGAIAIWTSVGEERGDSVAFALEVQDIPGSSASPALAATGQTARLIIPPPRTHRVAEFSVIPLSQVHPGIDRTPWKTVYGSHMIALTRDSLYEVCRLPCARSDTITLQPNQSVTWKG